MKVTKQKFIDYDSIGYGEDNGWHVMYDWNKMKNTIKWGTRIVSLVMAGSLVSLFLILKFDTSLLYSILSLLIYFILIIPIHEFFHLLAYTPNVFSDKCHIYLGFTTVSAFYDGEVSKHKALFSLILPFAAVSIILGFLMVIENNLMPYILIIMFMNAGGSWTDVYIFFYLLKKLPKNSIVYGNRYKL